MTNLKLYMLLLGCRPAGRNTEQHDIFFGIGTELKDLIPDIKRSWPEAKGNIHIDAWREVNTVDGFSVQVAETAAGRKNTASKKEAVLFFINLGGYKENEFDEFHYKILVAANNLESAKLQAKKTAFFKHNTLKENTYHHNATAHIDDKYGIDIDEVFPVADILPVHLKEKYSIQLSKAFTPADDHYHLGYFRLQDL